MQGQMPALPQPFLLNPLKDSVKVEAMDYFSDLRNLYLRLDNFIDLYDRGKLLADMIRYIPGLTKIAYQGQIDSTETKRKYADNTYKKKVIEFNILLTANHYTNFQNIHICFPLKFRSAADNDNDLAARTIPVNNFFVLREIDIVRYGDNEPVLPLIKNLYIYRYSDEILKHTPQKALKTF